MNREQVIVTGLVVTVGSAGLIALILFCAGAIRRDTRTWREGRKMYKWLAKNTRNKPAETHKSLLEISEGVRLPTDHVRLACLHNKKIFQSISKPENYSIWREEEQSIYEDKERGILTL
jgi:hypothetical protein